MKEINTFSLLTSMLEVTPKKGPRPQPHGVNFRRTRDDAVTVTATCGHALLEVRTTTSEIDCPQDTDLTACGDSLRRILKLFSYKKPPTVLVTSGGVYLDDYPIDLVDMKFPDTSRVINARTDKTRSANAQGVDLVLLASLAKSISRLVGFAEFTSHDFNGFMFVRTLGAHKVTVVLMPARI